MGPSQRIFPRVPSQMTFPEDLPRGPSQSFQRIFPDDLPNNSQRNSIEDLPRWPSQRTSPDDLPRWSLDDLHIWPSQSFQRTFPHDLPIWPTQRIFPEDLPNRTYSWSLASCWTTASLMARACGDLNPALEHFALRTIAGSGLTRDTCRNRERTSEDRGTWFVALGSHVANTMTPLATGICKKIWWKDQYNIDLFPAVFLLLFIIFFQNTTASLATGIWRKKCYGKINAIGRPNMLIYFCIFLLLFYYFGFYLFCWLIITFSHGRHVYFYTSYFTSHISIIFKHHYFLHYNNAG